MRIKHGKAVLWCTIVVFVLLRVMQYLFVIDESGFFIRETMWQSLLSDALYVAMALGAVLAMALRFGKQNKQPAYAARFGGTVTMVLSFTAAAALIVFGTIAYINGQWIGIVALLASIYFLLLPIRLSGKKSGIVNVTAVFALAYPCAAAINLFFSTFREIKASENVVDTVARCAMIIMFIGLTKLYMDFEEDLGRVSWCFFLYAAFGTLSGVGKLFGVLYTDTLTLLGGCEIVCDIVLWAMAIWMYHRCDAAVQKGELLFYAHRGASFDYPENTMLAFEKAIEQGADGIELDVQFTKDQQIVVCHDDTIDRTSDGSGYVDEMTYGQLLAYDFGEFKGSDFAGERIPLLSQVLELVKENDILLNIELKNRENKDTGLEKAVCDLVLSYQLQDKVLYSSFDHEMLRRLKEYEPTATIGALYAHTPDNAFEFMKTLKVDAIHPGKKTEQKLWEKALKAGWQVNVWTVDTAEEAMPLVQAGATGLITNRPEFLREQLSK